MGDGAQRGFARSEWHMEQPPEHLIAEIKRGNCVAFVGAGFLMPALPQWYDLIKGLSEKVKEENREDIDQLLQGFSPGSGTTSAIVGYEIAAQLIRGTLPDGTSFDDVLRTQLAPKQQFIHQIETRLELLYSIPFSAILTTNFDPVIEGKLPVPSTYREVLRSHPQSWIYRHPWGVFPALRYPPKVRPTVIKLHGDIDKTGEPGGRPVFTSQDYRERLFTGSGYLNFLRSIMSTRTVLFLGCSFSDHYLNLVTEEVMAQLDEHLSDKPAAYAILPDISESLVKHLQTNEGLCVFSYNSTKGHQPFDDFLKALARATDPQALLPDLVFGKRILWLDPKPKNNELPAEYLRGSVVITTKLEEAKSYLEEADGKPNSEGFDLVISHWGYKEGSTPSGKALLEHVRIKGIKTAIIIFASGDFYDENRKEALDLGAYEYTCTFQGLLQEIESFFSKQRR